VSNLLDNEYQNTECLTYLTLSTRTLSLQLTWHWVPEHWVSNLLDIEYQNTKFPTYLTLSTRILSFQLTWHRVPEHWVSNLLDIEYQNTEFPTYLTFSDFVFFVLLPHSLLSPSMFGLCVLLAPFLSELPWTFASWDWLLGVLKAPDSGSGWWGFLGVQWNWVLWSWNDITLYTEPGFTRVFNTENDTKMQKYRNHYPWYKVVSIIIQSNDI